MRRLSVLLACCALLVLAFPSAVLAQNRCTATLSGGAEVPPVETPATGSATVTISDDGTEIQYTVTYEGLTGDAAAAHIHFGSATEAGPVLLPLKHGPSPFSGTLTEADFKPVENGPQTFTEAVEAIRDGNTYVNIHTARNPGGEIRGQLACRTPDTSTSGSEATGSSSVPFAGLLAVGVLALLLATRRLSRTR